MFGTPPRHPLDDILQRLGRKLGSKRMVAMREGQMQDEENSVTNIQGVTMRQDQGLGIFQEGDLVIKKNYQRKHKLDVAYKPKVWRVLAAFENGSYVLVDKKGNTAKRRVNGATLRLFHTRK
ncbi:hypothetical protein CLU79DRAFT_712653 [Phycomyces nitens]|nr:hypothetical protein CLU79DRAFT_712653 [Phycomyces nitens]